MSTAPDPRATLLVALDRALEVRAGSRRRASLLALLAIYGGCLALINVLSDGADIGCILVALVAHIVWVAVRAASEARGVPWLVYARPGGLAVVGARALHLAARDLRSAAPLAARVTRERAVRADSVVDAHVLALLARESLGRIRAPSSSRPSFTLRIA